jgi:LmbE family N-acetylglucosaminyl deacetylase
MAASLFHSYPDLPPCDAPLDALVVAPHPDDAELGMGGTIAAMVQKNNRVGILDLTSGEPTPFGSGDSQDHMAIQPRVTKPLLGSHP